MWSNFGIDLVNAEGKNNSYTKPGHSVGCRMVGNEISLMSSLDELLQEHVLQCPHPSHDFVKMMFSFRCDETYTVGEIEEGKLL